MKRAAPTDSSYVGEHPQHSNCAVPLLETVRMNVAAVLKGQDYASSLQEWETSQRGATLPQPWVLHAPPGNKLGPCPW